MTIGKTLWVIILCKVFVLFFVLKLFFFPNRLKALPDDAAKGAFVATDLIRRAPDGDVGSAQLPTAARTSDPTPAPAPAAVSRVGSPETRPRNLKR